MTFLAQVLAGAGGGALNAALIRTRQPGDRGAPLAVCLAVAAGIYVGFGLQDGRPQHALWEALAALAFIAVAVQAPHAIRLMGIAWLAHGAWDAVHMVGIVDTRIPHWYPGACLGWDVVVGLAGLYWAKYADANRSRAGA